MKQWWLSRTPKDRQAVTVTAIVVLLLLIYLLVWLPFSQRIAQTRQLVSGQKNTLKWMQQHAAEVQRLRAAQSSSSRTTNHQALLTLVDRTAKQNHLRERIQRLKPQGSDSVQLWMEQAPFDTLIKWLGDLSVQYSISVESVNIERLETPGLVNARLNLHRESS